MLNLQEDPNNEEFLRGGVSQGLQSSSSLNNSLNWVFFKWSLGTPQKTKMLVEKDPRLPLKNTKFSELLSEEELYKRVYNTCVMIWAFVLIQLKFYINNFFLCVKIIMCPADVRCVAV